MKYLLSVQNYPISLENLIPVIETYERQFINIFMLNSLFELQVRTLHISLHLSIE